MIACVLCCYDVFLWHPPARQRGQHARPKQQQQQHKLQSDNNNQSATQPPRVARARSLEASCISRNPKTHVIALMLICVYTIILLLLLLAVVLCGCCTLHTWSTTTKQPNGVNGIISLFSRWSCSFCAHYQNHCPLYDLASSSMRCLRK